MPTKCSLLPWHLQGIASGMLPYPESVRIRRLGCDASPSESLADKFSVLTTRSGIVVVIRDPGDNRFAASLRVKILRLGRVLDVEQSRYGCTGCGHSVIQNAVHFK